MSGDDYSSLLGYCIYPDVLLDNPGNLPSIPAACLPCCSLLQQFVLLFPLPSKSYFLGCTSTGSRRYYCKVCGNTRAGLPQVLWMWSHRPGPGYKAWKGALCPLIQLVPPFFYLYNHFIHSTLCNLLPQLLIVVML